MYLIPKSRIHELARRLQSDHELFGPIRAEQAGQVMFARIADVGDLDLDAPIPAIPPKHTAFPQFEPTLSYRYDRASRQVELRPHLEHRPRALFGLRPCDLTALQCLDRFYLGQEYVDEVYRGHRRRMFLVTNTCMAPFPQCFCVCTDSGPDAREGYDLNLSDLGEVYLVEVGSEKAGRWIEPWGLPRADDSWRKRKEEKVDACLAMFDAMAPENKGWMSRVVNRVTTGLIPEEVWEHIGNQCFECGACSFVCPSCSCFNVVDVAGRDGRADRLRTWDSCSFEGYSRMAGGHNPRRPVEDRRNKRFFCKLSYPQSKKYLRPGCVGCGRCTWACPGDIGLPNVVTYIRRGVQK